VRTHRHALRHLAAFALYTGILAASFAAVADAGFGALVGHPVAVVLIFWGYAIAVCLAVTGVVALFGGPAAGLVIALMVILGNTSSGGPVGRPMLGPVFAAMTPVLPQGAGLSMVRGALYFHGHGIAAGLLAIAVWGGLGLGLLVSAPSWRRPASPVTGHNAPAEGPEHGPERDIRSVPARSARSFGRRRHA
jgi:hypothetical protein